MGMRMESERKTPARSRGPDASWGVAEDRAEV